MKSNTYLEYKPFTHRKSLKTIFPENSKHRLANGHVVQIIPAIKNVFASRSGEASSARPFRLRCRKILCFHIEKVPAGGLIKLLIFNLFGKQVTVGVQGVREKGRPSEKMNLDEVKQTLPSVKLVCANVETGFPRILGVSVATATRQVQHSRSLSRPACAALTWRHRFGETLLYVDSADRKSLLRNFDRCCQHVLEFHR